MNPRQYDFNWTYNEELAGSAATAISLFAKHITSSYASSIATGLTPVPGKFLLLDEGYLQHDGGELLPCLAFTHSPQGIIELFPRQLVAITSPNGNFFVGRIS